MKPTIQNRAKVSVLLIREAAEQMTGSGCCGRLEGDNSITGGAEAFREVRQQQAAFGILHRAVGDFFADSVRSGELEIVTIDPRNQLYLIPRLFTDVWRFRPGFFSGLSTVLQLFALPAVVVNGRVISRRGRPMDPDCLCHAVNQLLSAADSQPAQKVYS